VGEYIGVDIGGTKLAGAALHAGELGAAIVGPTRRSSRGILDDVVAIVERLRGARTRAIGIGVPSIVEFSTGRIRNSNNIPLADIPLRDVLTERLGLPVYIDNDANCAALAEAWDGDALLCPDLVMVTVGTGIGGGLVLDGRLYRGATGAAAEIGHTIIGMRHPDPHDRRAAENSGRWSLEQLAAGTELDRMARRTARAWPGAALGEILAVRGDVTGRDAVAAASAGDTRAMAAVRALGSRLGVGIANLINTFDPKEVVIGGGVSAAGDLLLDPVRESARRFVFPGAGTACVIRVARHGDVAGRLGSALLAKTEWERAVASRLAALES
jgi:glucokinase